MAYITIFLCIFFLFLFLYTGSWGSWKGTVLWVLFMKQERGVFEMGQEVGSLRLLTPGLLGTAVWRRELERGQLGHRWCKRRCY